MTGIVEIYPPVKERLSNISQKWFLMEPLYFSVFCTHQLVEDTEMSVPMRTGKHRVYYNPEMLSSIDDRDLEDYLKVEMIRILLKHPYQRMPFGAQPALLYLASNATIYDGMSSRFLIPLLPDEIKDILPRGKTFEEYYEWLRRSLPNKDNNNGSGQNQSDQSNNTESNDQSVDKYQKLQEALTHAAEAASEWEEDPLTVQTINELFMSTQRYGSIPGNMVETIKASIVAPINVSNLLKRFKKSVISQKRSLTRLRPSRRYGFEQMGSRFTYMTRILVAIDTSGSVDNDMLSRMLGLVNRIFKQGILQIDVLQFDTCLQLPIMPINKMIGHCNIAGRGGTDFQPATDFYIEHREYDGLIFITDGFAPNPDVKERDFSRPVEWIIVDDSYIPKIEHGWKRQKANV